MARKRRLSRKLYQGRPKGVNDPVEPQDQRKETCDESEREIGIFKIVAMAHIARIVKGEKK